MNSNQNNIPNDPLINTEIKEYRFEKLLGRGAFGAVYLARHPRLGKYVAVKYFHIQEEAQRADIKREIEILTQLNHQNVVRIIDAETYGSYQLIVMDYFAGGSLRSHLKKIATGHPDIPTIVQGMLGIARGLEHVHAQSILHLDLKPENVLLDLPDIDGHPRFALTDFGMSRINLGENVSAPGGTPPYMSPEHFGFGEGRTDARSDIYSFGIMLYEMLAGHVPFRAENLIQLAQLHYHENAPEPDVNIPPSLHEILFTTLEKQPERRFQSTRELRKALEAVEQSLRMSVTDSQPPNIISLSRLVQERIQAFQANQSQSPSHPEPKTKPAAVGAVQITITHTDGRQENFNLTQQSVIVGRGINAGLRLNYEQVSRQHARIDVDMEGSLYITDLSSINKTYLNGNALPEKQRTVWQPSDFVSIHGVTLMYGVNDETAAHEPVTAAAQKISTKDVESLLERVEKKEQAPRISMNLIPEIISVSEEMNHRVSVHIRTYDTPSAFYELKIYGPEVDQRWFILPAGRTIAANSSETLELTISPPTTDSIGRRTYEAMVEVVPHHPTISSVFRVIKMVVAPRMQFDITLSPKDIVHRYFGRTTKLKIANNGNYDETFNLYTEDHDLLNIQLETKEIIVPKHKTAEIPIKISPKGRAKDVGMLMYTVSATAKHTGMTHRTNGSYMLRRSASLALSSLPGIFLLVIALWYAYAWYITKSSPGGVLQEMIRQAKSLLELLPFN